MPEHTPPFFSPFDALLVSMDTQTLTSLVIALCAAIELMRHVPWSAVGAGLRRLSGAIGAGARWSARSTARTLFFVADQLDAFGWEKTVKLKFPLRMDGVRAPGYKRTRRNKNVMTSAHPSWIWLITSIPCL